MELDHHSGSVGAGHLTGGNMEIFRFHTAPGADEMIRAKWEKYSAAIIADHINSDFGIGLTKKQVADRARYLRLNRANGMPEVCKQRKRPQLWMENPELDEILKSRWKTFSSTEIASALNAQFGINLTRNAVIGRINRLGLAEKRSWMPKIYKKRLSNSPRRSAPARPKYDVELPDLLSDLQTPIEQRKSLLDLTAGTCRWPVGDPQSPEFFFCGGKTHEGKPYCTGHCAVAYNYVKAPRPPKHKQSFREWQAGPFQEPSLHGLGG
jgi:GcrA cell cycle regulator